MRVGCTPLIILGRPTGCVTTMSHSKALRESMFMVHDDTRVLRLKNNVTVCASLGVEMSPVFDNMAQDDFPNPGINMVDLSKHSVKARNNVNDRTIPDTFEQVIDSLVTCCASQDTQ
jgi:hypothetical protein